MGHRHNKKNKYTILWIILLILIFISFAYAYNIGDIKKAIGNLNFNSNNQNDYRRISVKYLLQNPENYIGEKIITSGVIMIGNGYSIKNEDGYYVPIANNCIESHRAYDYYHETYTAKGEWNGSYIICEVPLI